MFQSVKTLVAFGLMLNAGWASAGNTCSTGIHMMVAGGCGIPCAGDYPGILSSLISDITVQYPGSDLYYVPYNSSLKQGAVSSTWMIEAAKTYGGQCPNTPIVFLGWSLGGIISMNTVCGGLGPLVMKKNVIAAITYGEETYVGGLSYDKGTCTTNAPKYPRTTTSQCLPYASKIANYCDAEDSYCCTGGQDAGSHSAYAKYDGDAMNFITANYNARMTRKAAKAGKAT